MEKVVFVMLTTAILGLIALGIVTLLDAGAEGDRQLAEFIKAHDCKIIGTSAARNGFGNGQVVYIPGQTGYRCADGTEFWR